MKPESTHISVMLAVSDAPAAVAWYERALGAAVLWSLGSVADLKDHRAPWGVHRQGHFVDPFGHIWLVGDRSPLERFAGSPSTQ
jgi:uncharacterized glyoxalase superfamily protein PhnB